MKLICDRGALIDALNLAGGVVVSRTPKPVLQCVKLSAIEGELAVAATDLEIGLRVTTPQVEVQKPGEALVPADKFTQIVRESVDPTLTLELDGDALHIRGEDSRFKVFGQPAADFPPVPTFDDDADFEILAGELSALVSQTIYATARENSRYAINGVLMEREGKRLVVVATDGHRLAVARGDCESAQGDNRSVIVPTKALNLLLRLLDDPEALVKVRVAESQVLFASPAGVLASNLVEGNFPPYRDVIPKDGDRRATINTDAFASAVRRAALLTNEESKGVRLSFADGKLTLASRAPEMGEAEITLSVEKFDGENIDIGFNPAYVLDALKVVKADRVVLDMRAANKPGVLSTGPEFTYVIMPVNLQ